MGEKFRAYATTAALQLSLRFLALKGFFHRPHKKKLGTSILGAGLVAAVPLSVAAIQNSGTRTPQSESSFTREPAADENTAAPVTPAATAITSDNSPGTDNGGSSSNSSNNTVRTEVTVNGRHVEVPTNGTSQTQIVSDDGKSKVDVQVHNSTSDSQGNNWSSSSTSTHMHSTTSSSSNSISTQTTTEHTTGGQSP